jgi:hypothetical protein
LSGPFVFVRPRPRVGAQHTDLTDFNEFDDLIDFICAICHNLSIEQYLLFLWVFEWGAA